MAKKFPSECIERVGPTGSDKLLIWNSATGNSDSWVLVSTLLQLALTAKSIISIAKTNTVGLVDTYTITYTDSTTTTFNVTNGAAGADGVDGTDGANPEFQKSATHIQWRLEGDLTWLDLVPLADLKGDTGASIEMQVSATHVQWRVVGDVSWTNLIALSALKGDAGSGIASITKTGTVGLVDTYTITYDDASTDTFDVTNGAQGAQGGSTLNTPPTYVTLASPAIDMEAGEDFGAASGSFSCGAGQVFTITNEIQRKPIRLFLTDGTLSSAPVSGYTNSWITGQSEALYDPAKNNMISVEPIGTTAFISILNQYE